MKKTIICHSFPAWDAPYIKSTLELMKRLSATHRVIIIDYHYTWKDLFTNKYAPKKALLGLASRWRKINTQYGTVEVYNTPPVFPVNWINHKRFFKLVAGINGWLISNTLKRLQKRLIPEETVMVNAFNPVYGMLTHDTWKVSKKIYYCYDEIEGTTWSSKWGAPYEKEYLKKVDKVVTSSTELCRSKSLINPVCHLVKNGVDLNIFGKPELVKSRKWVIGYIGAIDQRIDAHLVSSLASQLPEYEFRFIGPVVSEAVRDLWRKHINIKCTGAVDQARLPEIIKSMDACIIPFVKNQLTASIYPLKINEYLAMGKPVVSTDFSDLSDFQSLISIATSPDEFLHCLEREIKNNTRLRIQKRVSFASQNGWESRAAQFAACL
jgi:glycosyltransferase involved in cell wall biosynthesis